MRKAAAVVWGFLLSSGCDHARSADSKAETAPSAKVAAERPCRITANTETGKVPLASELGQQIEVARGTKCVVLDTGAALTRVRITEGPYRDTVAWTQSGAVARQAP